MFHKFSLVFSMILLLFACSDKHATTKTEPLKDIKTISWGDLTENPFENDVGLDLYTASDLEHSLILFWMAASLTQVTLTQ